MDGSENRADVRDAMYESLRDLYSALPCGSIWYTIEENPKIRYCNKKALAVLGFSDRTAVISGGELEWYSLIDPRDREAVKNAHRSYLKGKKEDAEYTCRILGADGVIRWISAGVKKTWAENGSIMMQALFLDVTQQKSSVSTGAELYQGIANDAADGIYVIERETYCLLYANESVHLFQNDSGGLMEQKCYEALHGMKEPCPFCVMKDCLADHQNHEMVIPEYEKSYSVRAKAYDWNGVPAYVVYVADITKDVATRKEKERLEKYYQTLIRHLPGGVLVLSYRPDGSLAVEFLSEGLAAMTGRSQEEACRVLGSDLRSCIHPEDVDPVFQIIDRHLQGELDFSEAIFRMKRKDESYIWVRNNSSRIVEADGSIRIYSVCHDVTKDMEEQIRLRKKYDDMLIRHHRTLDTNEIMAGHCNITQGKMVEVTDKTGSRLLEQFGMDREKFFTAFGSLILDEEDQQKFYQLFLNQPMREAFEQGSLKHELKCFLRLPQEAQGRYVRINVDLVRSPESGDVIGVLAVSDDTEQVMSERVLHRLVNINSDFIADVDLIHDRYKLISGGQKEGALPTALGSFTGQAKPFLEEGVLPKDKDLCSEMLDLGTIKRRLTEDGSYSFHYSLMTPDGIVQTKNMLIFYIDERLGRVCLSRTDVTESVREQQGLLNMLAYTFELAGFIDLATENFVMYTRESVLNNLAPYRSERFSEVLQNIMLKEVSGEELEKIRDQFQVGNMRRQLEEKTTGYEFIVSFQTKDGLRHKQFNVLWGDETRNTICIVRADVTDMLLAEQKTKEELKDALVMAQEASKAKTDFLSSMSHDIRTPMNAIIGMTDLALADPDNQEQTIESLGVIKNSSEHLLRLINDILDMSRIESGRMILAREPFRHSTELKRTVERNQVLADRKGICFQPSIHVKHDCCVGDVLRIQQIIDNLLSNAFKFTPEGGTVAFDVTELSPKNERLGWYRFTISDSGIGISPDKLARIFEPFYRVENQEVRRTEGTGLGLSIVKNLVDYKGGMIEVKSEPEGGTRFIVTLPLSFADEEPMEDEMVLGVQKSEPDLSGRSVLLVEDHPINQLVARRILEKLGAKVTVANNGKEGAAAFTESEVGEFHMILMDIQMPLMDGYEATEVIRGSSHPQAESIPIVAMTANAFAGDVRKCLDAGMNAHIAKPIDRKNLFSVLKKYL